LTTFGRGCPRWSISRQRAQMDQREAFANSRMS
jgi:hypothetical protein